MPGALVNGANTSDRISYGAGTGLGGLDPFSILLWVYPTTFTSTRRLYSRCGTGTYKRLQLSGTSGAMALFVDRATTDTSFVTNTNPLVINVWNLVACVFNSSAGAGQVGNIYRGAIGTLATECGYSTSTDGSGALDTESSAETEWGNDLNDQTRAFQGRIAVGAIFAAALSLADIQSWQLLPRITVGANTAVAFGRGGMGGADWVEYSANTGTVTGATQGDGPPIGANWTRRRSGIYTLGGPFLAAA